jgi:hypothetical protein
MAISVDSSALTDCPVARIHWQGSEWKPDVMQARDAPFPRDAWSANPSRGFTHQTLAAWRDEAAKLSREDPTESEKGPASAPVGVRLLKFPHSSQLSDSS